MRLSDSMIQLIGTIIGSSLVVTALTASLSEFNKPNIYLNVLSQQPTDKNIMSTLASPVQSYQIIARNDGRSSATNVTVSMFFSGKILDAQPILHSEDVKDGNSTTEGRMSFRSFYIPRLASGALVIFQINMRNATATIIDPYFVSASYDQGSNQYPNYLPVDVQTGRFPNILAGRIDPGQQVAILSSILAGLSFGVALVGTETRRKIIKKRISPWLNTADLIWVIPLTVLVSIFVLFVFEELPRNLLISSFILIRPADVTTGVSIFTPVFTLPNGPNYNQGQLLAGAFMFCIISWFARYMIGYLVVRKIILYQSNTYLRDPMKEVEVSKLKDYLESRKFRIISFLVIGTPISSFIILFFSKSTEGFYPASLFMIFLVVDIIRMLSLIMVIPKWRTIKNLDILYYVLVAVTAVIAIAHFALLSLIIKAFGGNPSNVVASGDTLVLFIFYFSMIVAILQSLSGYFIAYKSKSILVYDGGRFLIAVLWFVWVAILLSVTTTQHQILRLGIPIVNIGITTILSGVAYWVIASYLKKKIHARVIINRANK